MRRFIAICLFAFVAFTEVTVQAYTHKGLSFDYKLSFSQYYLGDNGFLFDIISTTPTKKPLTVYISKKGMVYVCEGDKEYKFTFTKDDVEVLPRQGETPIVVFGFGKTESISLYGKAGINIKRLSYSIAAKSKLVEDNIELIKSNYLSGQFFDNGVVMTAERKKAILNNLVNNMVLIEGGTFTMGATPEQTGYCEDNEKPVHQVTLSSFSIGRYEVTQEEWEAVMGNNPSKYKGAHRPVEMVSWPECITFIRKLNAATGKRFRLPTEAEWEYAARGGKLCKGYRYSGSNDYKQVAWTSDDCRNPETGHQQVGSKLPNELGLYDMSGNVMEWCHDWEGSYPSGKQTNPKGPASGQYRIVRGGDWYNRPTNTRASLRMGLGINYHDWCLGLRLAM